MTDEMKKKLLKRNSKGQAIVEYIIIIVIVALASITVMSIFSDRVRTLIAAVASTLGANNAAAAVENSSASMLQEMDANGIDLGSGN